MKAVPLSALLVFVAVGATVVSIPAGAQVTKGATAKLAIKAKVLQVVEEGLLMSGGGESYLITGHPKQKALADGEMINCYVAKTERLFKYTDGGGHKRTIRVYRYLNERKGR